MSMAEEIGKLKELQKEMARRVEIREYGGRAKFVAGVDSAFLPDRVIAAACLYKLPGLELVEEAHATSPLTYPYVPGFLCFREGPAATAAVRALKYSPDIIIFDGQGIAHPRGLGIASYAGVELGLPSIGCAKSRLVGEYKEPGEEKGSVEPLIYKGSEVGGVIRTRTNVKPVFVSPGHLIDSAGSIALVLECVSRFRLPEPVRAADRLAKRLKSKY